MPLAPFETAQLDQLMDRAGIDLLLATSKPAVQYLLGGYRFFFFEHADAIGQSRYLPIMIYPKGRPDKAGFIGHRMEKGQLEVSPLWVPEPHAISGGSADAMQHAVTYVREHQLPATRIGIETAFLPVDAFRILTEAFPDSMVFDALPALERLRARKTNAEIDQLRRASDLVVESMLAVIQGHGPGTSKRKLVEALRREEVSRGLTFDYCLITAGSSLNRAPSDQRWEQGDILSLDSGANYNGYIGDVCRMGILGEPDSELVDLLAEVDAVQQAAMAPVRAGAPGHAIYDCAGATLQRSTVRDHMDFVAHGMGLVSHEVPHLTSKGPVPYAAEDADRALEAGLVLSIETTLKHPRRGFIKLEDTVLVRAEDCEVLGAAGRVWNRGNIRASAHHHSEAALAP